MAFVRAFISGVMVTHELDEDRAEARQAVEMLGPGYEAVAIGDSEDLPDEGIASCNVLILLVAKAITAAVLSEFNYADYLGLRRCVFVRDEGQRTEELSRFLDTCGCDVVPYSRSRGALAAAIVGYLRSIRRTSPEEERVAHHTKLVFGELVRVLSGNFDDVWTLSPGQFEDLVEHILREFGYETSLTPATRDGGFDILAVRTADPIFPTVHLVEAKLWLPPRRVGVPVIRAVYGAGIARNCNGVMVITPADFTRDAVRFVENHQLQQYVRLVGGEELPTIFKEYLRLVRGDITRSAPWAPGV